MAGDRFSTGTSSGLGVGAGRRVECVNRECASILCQQVVAIVIVWKGK